MSLRLIAPTLAFVVGFPLLSFAGPVFDFSGSGDLGVTTKTITLGTDFVTASGWYLDAADLTGGPSGTWKPNNLWGRNVTNDHGLGVCSPGESNCSGDGNFNEISQKVNQEAIVLQKNSAASWTFLWLSSLDNNDGAGAEMGIMFWGSSGLPGTLIGGSSLPFQFPKFGGSLVEGKFAAPNFGGGNPDFLMFMSNGLLHSDNDFLLWGADTVSPGGHGDNPAVPEPGTLSLLGLGLVGLAKNVRRRFHA